MNHVTSRDGTIIAFDKMGEGEPVIVVGGATCDRAITRPLAERLARHFTVFNYDRRGRGDSGDTLPYAVEREIEDIGAVLAEAGGTASVYGHSSGAALALHAAAHGLPVARLALHEPPYTPDDEERKRTSRKDAEEIKTLLAEGHRGDAITYILSEIGMPREIVTGMSCDERVVAMAHTLAYDSEVMGDISRGGTVPFDLVERVKTPTLVLVGGASPAWMIDIGRQVADTMPEGRHKVLDGQEHFAPPRCLRRCFRSSWPAGTAADRQRRIEMLLEDKNAVVYGAGGGIGGGVARTFAREGARVFLAGRTREPLEAVASDIAAAGGSAEVAELDALDERAVDEHARAVASQAGGIDVSFNLVSRGGVQGVPLVEMTSDDLLRAVVNGLHSNFITARAAARRMIERGSGVVLHLNSASGAGAMPGMGSTGPADAATEAFMRYLAAEVGPRGVRVCGIWTAGVAETLSDEKISGVGGENAPDARTVEEMIAGMAALRRAPKLADVAETAAFLASDRAAGMTGTMANVTSGLVLR